MNTELHAATEQYVGVWNNRLVAHTGIIHLPMQKGKKRVHRLVVLPDYQGIGIGTAFITAIGKIIEARGYELNLTTTTPAIVNVLVRRDDWILARYGRVKNNLDYFVKRYGLENKKIDRCSSAKRVTYSFWYKGGANDNEENTGERDNGKETGSPEPGRC